MRTTRATVLLLLAAAPLFTMGGEDVCNVTGHPVRAAALVLRVLENAGLVTAFDADNGGIAFRLTPAGWTHVVALRRLN